MGPTTDHFQLSKNTRIYLDEKSIRLATAILSDDTTTQSQQLDVLSMLKQVRSKFDCLSTYTMCRSFSDLSAPSELQPVTIWTACENDSPQKIRSQVKVASVVFCLLAINFIKHGRKARLEQVEWQENVNLDKMIKATKIISTLTRIGALIPTDGYIDIIGNAELNSLLVELAGFMVSELHNINKSRISDMEKIVYR